MERSVRGHLRVNVISDVVQPVSTPDTVSALEQFLGRDVDLLVNPTVVLVLGNVIALLAGDALLLLDLVTPGAAMEVHLEREVSLFCVGPPEGPPKKAKFFPKFPLKRQNISQKRPPNSAKCRLV